MRDRYQVRVIDGVTCLCQDIGCDDFDRAVQNRNIIKNKLSISGYIEIEQAVGRTPLSKPLPSWIPLGDIPSVSRHELSGLSGGHIEDEEEEKLKVVGVRK